MTNKLNKNPSTISFGLTIDEIVRAAKILGNMKTNTKDIKKRLKINLQKLADSEVYGKKLEREERNNIVDELVDAIVIIMDQGLKKEDSVRIIQKAFLKILNGETDREDLK